LLKRDVKSCGRTTDITATTDAFRQAPSSVAVSFSLAVLRVPRPHSRLFVGAVSEENIWARRSNQRAPRQSRRSGVRSVRQWGDTLTHRTPPPSAEDIGWTGIGACGRCARPRLRGVAGDDCRLRGHDSSCDHPFDRSASRWLPFFVLAPSRYLSTAVLRSSVKSAAFTYTVCRAPLMRHKPSLAIVLRWAL
jgi:hypothetical protein